MTTPKQPGDDPQAEAEDLPLQADIQHQVVGGASPIVITKPTDGSSPNL